MDGMSKSKFDPCKVCSLRVKANSILCFLCGKLIHGRCAGMKKVAPRFYTHFSCRIIGNNGEAVE